MTATIQTTETPAGASSRGRYVRAGITTGIVAGAANLAVAAVTHAVGASLEIKAESIPVYAFAQVTVVAALIGIALAAIIARRSPHPARTFSRLGWTLTLVSLVPPAIVDADIATKGVLVATHLLAAIIVIPAIAGRLQR